MSVNPASEIAPELREYAEKYGDPTNELMRDAADTIEAQDARIQELETALEIIAGRRPALDNLMGNRDIAIAALSHINTKEAEK